MRNKGSRYTLPNSLVRTQQVQSMQAKASSKCFGIRRGKPGKFELPLKGPDDTYLRAGIPPAFADAHSPVLIWKSPAASQPGFSGNHLAWVNGFNLTGNRRSLASLDQVEKRYSRDEYILIAPNFDTKPRTGQMETHRGKLLDRHHVHVNLALPTGLVSSQAQREAQGFLGSAISPKLAVLLPVGQKTMAEHATGACS